MSFLAELRRRNVMIRVAGLYLSDAWLMLLGKREAAVELLMPYERSGNLQALAGYLTYRKFDPSPFPSLMRVLEREKVQRPPAEPLPFACKRSGAD